MKKINHTFTGEFADLLISDLVVAAYANAGMAREGMRRADVFLKRFELLGARGPGTLSTPLPLSSLPSSLLSPFLSSSLPSSLPPSSPPPPPVFFKG
jgi:hypothetical protein